VDAETVLEVGDPERRIVDYVAAHDVDGDVFYLQSRGLDDEAAKQLIVSGFIEPITGELPIEYAVELNRLVELEMEGSLG
jgi:hypothetical protein